jgi:hypothetical protein
MIAAAANAPTVVAVGADSLEEVPQALRDEKRAIEVLYARRDAHSVLIRWRIGARVLAVRNGKRRLYGAHALANLATMLKRAKRGLYQLSEIADQ